MSFQPNYTVIVIKNSKPINFSNSMKYFNTKLETILYDYDLGLFLVIFI